MTIRDEVQYDIHCDTDAEYAAEKARILALPKLVDVPEFRDEERTIRFYRSAVRE